MIALLNYLEANLWLASCAPTGVSLSLYIYKQTYMNMNMFIDPDRERKREGTKKEGIVISNDNIFIYTFL